LISAHKNNAKTHKKLFQAKQNLKNYETRFQQQKQTTSANTSQAKPCIFSQYLLLSIFLLFCNWKKVIERVLSIILYAL
jgi:hypothetical protein